MMILVNGLIALIALLHMGFLILEMFFWSKSIGLRIFKQSREAAKTSARLAANQGLYNGFLAAGLLWGLVHPHPEFAIQIQFFFLTCVVIAGIYGAVSVSRNILFVQTLPAIFALTGLLLTR